MKDQRQKTHYLTEEELDNLTRFRWTVVILGLMAGLSLSFLLIVLTLLLLP